MVHCVSLSTAQVKWLDVFKFVPPIVASQPIPSNWLADVLQLIDTGSPYFTTTLGGLNSMGQEACTPKECIHMFCISYSVSKDYMFDKSLLWLGISK